MLGEMVGWRCGWMTGVMLSGVSMVSVNAQALPFVRPTAVVELQTDAEARVAAHVDFDASGRLLILCRDKGHVRSGGNWHLIRLTDILSGKPQREEITFAIPQEPTGRRGSRWEDFSSDLFVTSDRSRAYANFRGNLDRPDEPNSENIDEFFFESVVSFNLSTFRMVASGDVHGYEDGVVRSAATDHRGNLVVWKRLREGVQVTALDESLHVLQRSLSPYPKSDRGVGCGLAPELGVECQEDKRGGALKSFCDGRPLERISSDQHSLLDVCLETGGIFRPGWAKALAQVADADTLAVRASISLPKFAEIAYAIFHSRGVTTVAVLENGSRLKVYAIEDGQAQ